MEDNAPFRQILRENLQTSLPTIAIDEVADGTEALQKVDAFLERIDALFDLLVTIAGLVGELAQAIALVLWERVDLGDELGQALLEFRFVHASSSSGVHPAAGRGPLGEYVTPASRVRSIILRGPRRIRRF